MFGFITPAQGRTITVVQRYAVGLAVVLVLSGSAPVAAEEAAPIDLRVIGGLGGVSQYVDYEKPFWTREVPRLTNGRVRAEIVPSGSNSIRGTEMLGLLRLGVVSFGTITLAVAASDDPELGAMDLPALNPSIADLQQSRDLLRPRLEMILRERYNVQLLAVYTYPAQVMFCRESFTGLADLAGRRIRVSSIGQAELIEALGATPVVVPFAQIANAIKDSIVECAITGSLSGNALGLQDVASTMSRQAISWGVSLFGANISAWNALPVEVRAQLQEGLSTLETRIWQVAEQETEDGFACNAGLPKCISGKPGHMVVLDTADQDRQLRARLLRSVVLPKWIQRCGEECVTVWNRYMAPARGITAVTK